MTAPRPVAAMAMIPGVDTQLFSAGTRADLDALVELVSPIPVDLAGLDDDVLEDVEIVVGGWGCNLLDEALLARMPKLRLLAYAAGTVKMTVTPETFEHGVLVSSAAAANAVPVAEFTFAAIVMIAKDVFRVRDHHRDVRGRTPVPPVGPAVEVGARGLKIGVIGASSIGRLVIERLRSLDVEIAVADPYLDDDGARRSASRGGSSTTSSAGPTSSPSTRPNCRRPATSSMRIAWPACTTARGS